MQQQRVGNELLRKLGAAYYAQQKGMGTEQATETALATLEAHIAEHGDGFMRG